MLTITAPEIFPVVAALPCGLLPIRIQKEEKLVLVIKCSKEIILTAKINKGFKFYLCPIKANEVQTYGLITAFFDDYDEPLTICSPLFVQPMGSGRQLPYDFIPPADICKLLSAQVFDVHFFDEHSRELLAYQVRNKGMDRFRSLVNTINFVPFTLEIARQFLDEMQSWFSTRTAKDDDEALSIGFEKALFPDNLYIMDVTPEANFYHGRKVPMHTMLERKNAGHFNELDIVKILQRVFTNDQIYLNPIRPDDKKEFTDVCVATKKNVLLIQAKDSPNLEGILRRSIERKRAMVVSHLEKAVNQMRGSVSYSQSCKTLEIIASGQLHKISLEGRNVISLIIVKELFNSEFSVYSPPVLELFNETGVPCFILDYPELHMYNFHLRTEESFIAALEQVFEVALQRGQFPRLRFGLSPSDRP